MSAPQKFSLREVVRIKSQPPARAHLVGEWAVVASTYQGLVGPLGYDFEPLEVPQELVNNVYMVDLYRKSLFNAAFRQLVVDVFNEVDLESKGELDPFCGDEDAETAARREAALTIARKQLYVCVSGGFLAATWGIQESEKKLVEGLPHRVLASGCCDPNVRRGNAFTKVFNQEIVKHLLERRP